MASNDTVMILLANEMKDRLSTCTGVRVQVVRDEGDSDRPEFPDDRYHECMSAYAIFDTSRPKRFVEASMNRVVSEAEGVVRDYRKTFKTLEYYVTQPHMVAGGVIAMGIGFYER